MVTWLVRVLVTVLVLGSAGTAVFLNLPVHPPTGFTSPTGTAAAPEIVSRITGHVLSARRAVETAGAPAVAVDFLTPSRGWAITGCGYARSARDVRTGEFRLCTIRSTLNNGLSWRAQWTTLRQLSGISFVTNLDGYTWTGSGVCATASCPTRLYGTANGGRTWTLRFVGSAAWTSLVVTGPNTLWGTVGGELLRSVDGGRTWQLQTVHGCIPEKVAFDGPVGMVTGASPGGLCVERTVNGGRTFTPVITSLQAKPVSGLFARFLADTGLSPFVGGILGARSACTNGEAVPSGAKGIWLVVGCNTINPNMLAVWHSSNGGFSWRSVWSTAGCATYCTARGLGEEPLAFVPGASTVFRTAPGAIARSTDGGRHFTTGGPLCRTADCRPALNFLTPAQGYAATSQGLFATVNGGTTWQRLWPAAGPGPLASVSLVGRGIGFAVPEIAPNRILETRDGGLTWHVFAVVPGDTSLSLIDFLSSRSGYVCGTRDGVGVLLRTTNGGRTFETVPLPHVAVGNAQIADLSFRNLHRGFAVDVFGDGWRTVDGGQHWTGLAAPPLGHPQAIAWSDPRTVYVSVLQKGTGDTAGTVSAGGHFGLLVSHDGGSIWTPLVAWPWPPAPDQFATNVLAVYGTNVWAFAYGGLILSSDGGARWTETRLPANLLSPAFLTFEDRMHGWLLTTSGRLYVTTDGGSVLKQAAVGPLMP